MDIVIEIISLGSYFPKLCAFTILFTSTTVSTITIFQTNKLCPLMILTLGSCLKWFVEMIIILNKLHTKADEVEIACAVYYEWRR